MIKSFFWTKPYEPEIINNQITMLLSAVFIAIFGKPFIVYFLFLQYPLTVVEKWIHYYCRESHRKQQYCGRSWDYCDYVHSKFCVQKYVK